MFAASVRSLVRLAIFISTLGICTLASFVPAAHAQSTCSAPATARTVAICAPINNSVNDSPVRVLASAKAGSSPVTRMEVWVDGAKKYQAASTTQVDTSLALPAGMHRITVQAIDSAGAFKNSVSITISAGGQSCTAPSTSRTLRICEPLNGATVSAPVNVEAAANQSTTIKSMQLYVDGVKKYETTGARLSTVISPAPGTHRLSVQALDASGWFKSSVTVTVAGALVTETVASGLFAPWEIVWTPDGRMFFTEQIGKLRVVQNGALL